MFNNRSFTVVVALALLGVVTLIFGTAVGMPPAAPRAIGASDWFERHSDSMNSGNAVDSSDWFLRHRSSGFRDDADAKSSQSDVSAPNTGGRRENYAALKGAQLEQMDDVQFGSASTKAAGEEESYRAMQKEQRAAMKSIRDTAAAVQVRPKSYAELKDAQLEQMDAVQFGSASATAAGKNDDLLTMQKEQRAMQKELRAAARGWIYHYDSLTNKWYAYHYSTTPTGPVIDETIELLSSPK